MTMLLRLSVRSRRRFGGTANCRRALTARSWSSAIPAGGLSWLRQISTFCSLRNDRLSRGGSRGCDDTPGDSDGRRGAAIERSNRQTDPMPEDENEWLEPDD